jgi:predicted small secreted protein
MEFETMIKAALKNLSVWCVLTACLTTLFLAGCNTTEGVGEDIQEGGEAIEGAAEGAQNS